VGTQPNRNGKEANPWKTKKSLNGGGLGSSKKKIGLGVEGNTKGRRGDAILKKSRKKREQPSFMQREAVKKDEGRGRLKESVMKKKK